MRSVISRIALAAAAVCLTACSSCRDKPGPSENATPEAGTVSAPLVPAGKRITIAVVPKGTTQEYWRSVHAGAVKASREVDVDIVWKGPTVEDDLKAQVDTLSGFVADHVTGIVLAPLNDVALKAPVQTAVDAKIPVIVFDSDMQGTAQTSFVATDNEAAGRIAAEGLARALDNKGNVVLLRYQEGSASTTNREKGFLEGIKTKTGLAVVSDNQYAGPTTDTAAQKSAALLEAHKSPGVDGVFAPNELTTLGMLEALKKSGRNKKVKLVGFDATAKLLAALREGDIEGLIVQNPFNMGYVAVKTMADYLRGKPVEKRVDTGARYVDKSNIDDPAIKDIIAPDLKPWLGE